MALVSCQPFDDVHKGHVSYDIIAKSDSYSVFSRIQGTNVLLYLGYIIPYPCIGFLFCILWMYPLSIKFKEWSYIHERPQPY